MDGKKHGHSSRRSFRARQNAPAENSSPWIHVAQVKPVASANARSERILAFECTTARIADTSWTATSTRPAMWQIGQGMPVGEG